MKRKAAELDEGEPSSTVLHASAPSLGVPPVSSTPAVAAVKKETIDEKSVAPRLPRKKGPKPKRIRRIILKPLTEEEEDSLLDNLDASIQERKQNDDPILARMRRKLALRQVPGVHSSCLIH